MRISETKLPAIFLVAAIALLSCWMRNWALIQHHFAAEFLLLNSVIAAVILSSRKPLSSLGKVEDEINRQSHVAEIEEVRNDDHDHDDVDDGCSGHDECDGNSECCEGDYVDPEDLERRADEFIAKMTQRWMEEKEKEKLNYELLEISNQLLYILTGDGLPPLIQLDERDPHAPRPPISPDERDPRAPGPQFLRVYA